MEVILKKALEEKKPPTRIVNFRCTEEQYRNMKDKSKKYYNGNTSGWIKYCAVRHIPHDSELTSVDRRK